MKCAHREYRADCLSCVQEHVASLRRQISISDAQHARDLTAAEVRRTTEVLAALASPAQVPPRVSKEAFDRLDELSARATDGIRDTEKAIRELDALASPGKEKP